MSRLEYRPKPGALPGGLPLLCDFVDPETGKTFREKNNELTHEISIGTLVDVIPWEGAKTALAGIRLRVTGHARDCDGTPLYSLGVDSELLRGYTEDALRVVK